MTQPAMYALIFFTPSNSKCRAWCFKKRTIQFLYTLKNFKMELFCWFVNVKYHQMHVVFIILCFRNLWDQYIWFFKFLNPKTKLSLPKISCLHFVEPLALLSYSVVFSFIICLSFWVCGCVLAWFSLFCPALASA